MTKSSSPYRGVVWHSKQGQYRVKVSKNDQAAGRQRIFYKEFHDEETAARVYDVVAQILHGPDAVLNFDGEPPRDHPGYEILQWMIEQGTITPTEAITTHRPGGILD